MNKESRQFRRRQDDVEAGMLFAWRTPGGSFGRTLAGVFVATVLFAGAASLVHVRIPMSPLPSQEAAELIVLDPRDERARELIDWARFHSPYPDRWDPPGTGTLEREMAALDRALSESVAYEPRLLPRLEGEVRQSPSGLIDLEPFKLPQSDVVVAQPLRAKVVRGLRAVSVAKGPLKDLWGEKELNWPGKEGLQLLGLQSSFLVGVEPATGRVGFCLVLEGAGEAVDGVLHGWLRGQGVEEKLEGEELVFDVLTVRFEEFGGAEKLEGGDD